MAINKTLKDYEEELRNAEQRLDDAQEDYDYAKRNYDNFVKENGYVEQNEFIRSRFMSVN